MMRYLSFAALAAALCSFTQRAIAQVGAQAPDLHFDGSITIPVSVESVHPDINYVQVSCSVQPQGGTWGQGIVWNDNPIPGARMSGGSFNGTFTAHFTAHRSSTFVSGEVWNYECAISFLNPKDANHDGTPGTGPSFAPWAQLTSGSAVVKGTFTLQ